MLKIRQSHDHLILNMGIPILGKDSLYIEMGPRAPLPIGQQSLWWHFQFIKFLFQYYVIWYHVRFGSLIWLLISSGFQHCFYLFLFLTSFLVHKVYLCNGNLPVIMSRSYRQVSNIRRTLVGNKIVDHSDVIGASPVGAAPTTSSFST